MADGYFLLTVGHDNNQRSSPIRLAATYDAGTGIYTLATGGGGGTSNVRVVNGASFDIPQYDSVEFTYVNGGAADDDLISTQVFKNNGATVATLTYAYEGSTNNIASITQS